MKRIGWIFDRAMDVMAGIGAALLLFMTATISYTILARVVGFNEPLWIVQFNGYALLWVTFLGAAWLLKRKKHVNIDSFNRFLSPRGQIVLNLIHGVVGALVCATLAWFGTRETISNFVRGIMDVQAVDVPKYLIVGFIPLGFFFLTIQFIRDAANAARELGGTHDDGGTRAESDGSPEELGG